MSLRNRFKSQQVTNIEPTGNLKNAVSPYVMEPENNEQRDRERSAFWDSVPTIYKDAYNKSIEGMMHQMMTGKKYYDIADVPRGVVHDIGAGFLSFFASKTDIALSIGAATGAGIALRTGVTTAAKRRAAIMLGKKLTYKGKPMGIRNATSLVDDVVNYGGVQAAMLGTYDGFYYAAKEARDEILDKADITKYKQMDYGQAFQEVLKHSKGKDFFRGGFLGLAGGIGRTSRFLAPFSDEKLGREAYKRGVKALAGETFTMGALSPLAYEGRLPGFQDLIMAAGVTGAIAAPASLVAKRKGRIRDELSKKHNQAIASEAKLQDIYTAEGAELYQQIQQPFARVKDIKEAGNKYKRENVFKIGRGEYAFINLMGRRIRGGEASVEGAKIVKGKNKGKVDEQITIDSHKSHITFATGRIVDNSIRQTNKGLTAAINIEGKGQFLLDEFNTELFFKFHSEDPKLISQFEKNLKGVRNSKNALDLHYDQQLRVIREKAFKSEDGYLPEDWMNSVMATMNRYMDDARDPDTGKKIGQTLFKRWEKSIADGKPVRIKDMTLSEKKLMAKMMQNQTEVRKFLKENLPDYDINYMYQPHFMTNSKRGIIRSFVTPFYYHITDPYLRKATRLIQNVANATEQKSAERLNRLDSIIKPKISFEKAHSNWWKTYLDGTGEQTAFKDFKTIAQFEADNPGKGFKLYLRDLRKKAEKFTGGEKERLTARANFLEASDELTTSGVYNSKTKSIDSIWKDAKQAGLRVGQRIDGYLPRMLRKDVLDIMFDQMESMERKIMKITGGDFNIDGNYNTDVLQRLESMLQGIIRKMEGSSKPDAVVFKQVWDLLANKESSAGIPKNYNVFRVLHHNLFSGSLKEFSPLEKSRKIASSSIGSKDVTRYVAEAFENYMETDYTKIMTEYIGGATKRIELSKAFTPTGAYFNQLIKMADGDLELDGGRFPKSLGGQFLPFSQQTQVAAVRMIKESFTGEYNFRVKNPMSESLQSLSNLEMMSKISLGQAFIPNLTQSFISTSVDQGFGSMFKGLVKFAVNADFRKRVRESGATILTAFDDMMQQDRALQIGASEMMKTQSPIRQFVKDWAKGEVKSKDAIAFATRKTSYLFSKVNSWNQIIAAATAEEAAKKYGRILAGKKDFLTTMVPGWAKDKRIAWAKGKATALGLDPDDLVKNLDALERGVFETAGQQQFRRRLLLGMKKFASETQLQRNFLKDPIMFNDPMLKPLLLFKRFGLRQAQYIDQTIRNEVKHGNLLPILRLGIGGFAGGNLVMWAKDQLNAVITGEEQYTSKESRMKQLRTPEWQDYINALTSVGSFGVIGDIMGSDEPMTAIKFFVKPVILDDFERVLKSYETFARSMETNYPEQWDVPFRKGFNTLAPILGPNISRIARTGIGLDLEAATRLPFMDKGLVDKSFKLTPGLQTEGMKKDRIEYYKKTAVEGIRDALLNGRAKEAERLYLGFNEVYGIKYPSLAISQRDISFRSIERKFLDRVKKQQEEKQFIP